MTPLEINNIVSLTDFRNNIKKYINKVNTTKKSIILTQHGKSTAVLLDSEQFQEMKDQIEFMRKIVRGLEDYKQNRVHTVSEVFNEIDNIIANAES